VKPAPASSAAGSSAALDAAAALDRVAALDHYAAELAALERIDQRRRRLTVESPQGARIVVDGRSHLAFCSNDYLGLAADPRLVEAAVAGLRMHGVGAGASHLVTGHHAPHARAERALAEFVGLPAALLFGSGYLANIGVVTALSGAEDAIFSDALNHASLIDGMRLSRARVVRYPHGDLDALDAALATHPARARFVATESVFSMDGDLAPLDRLAALCERHDAWLLIDDAHGLGVLGAHGRGALEHFALRSSRVVYVGTLGKAVGVHGAFVAAASEIVETVLQRARSYIYTTASPPFLGPVIEASLAIVREEAWRREHLRALIARFRAGLAASGLRLAASASPIQPVLLGTNAAALAASRFLRDRGLIVTAIRPPTVAEGTARLRVSLSAAHTADDVDRLVDALRELGRAGA
jgi:8-amino-7-oxononanoate synthase